MTTTGDYWVTGDKLVTCDPRAEGTARTKPTGPINTSQRKAEGEQHRPDGGGEASESGTQYSLTDTAVETRGGVRLTMRCDTAASAATDGTGTAGAREQNQRKTGV